MMTNSFLTDQPLDSFVTKDQFNKFSPMVQQAYIDFLEGYLKDCRFAGNNKSANQVLKQINLLNS